MKKFFLSVVVLLGSFAVNAQLVEVSSMERVRVPEGMVVNVPTISPDGSFVVVSDAASEGLTKIDLATGKSTLVTNNGSGSNVAISADGSQVVYRQTTVGRDKLRKVALKSKNLLSGKEVQIVAPSRKLNAGVAMVGNTVTSVENGKMRAKSLDGTRAQQGAVVSINRGHLEYTVNGKTVTLDPQGRGSYLWPALSPDGTKVAYYLAGRGCYVCNVDGTNVKAVGPLRATKWLNNDVLVGMKDADDGHIITSSAIIAADLNGTYQTLTTDAQIALYPSPTADGSRIAFSTPEGELFIINLK